jgi:hypothetical protein
VHPARRPLWGGDLALPLCSVYLTELDTRPADNDVPFARFAAAFVVVTPSGEADDKALTFRGAAPAPVEPAAWQ